MNPNPGTSEFCNKHFGGLNPKDWIEKQVREKQQSSLRPGSAEFCAVLDEIKQLHLRKTLDYGCDEDALSNIRSSSDVINVSPWAGCILRISDKMHRLRSYFRRGRVEFDGIEDTMLDIAAYAVIALVLYRESRKPCPSSSPSPLTTSCGSSIEHVDFREPGQAQAAHSRPT